MSKKTINCVKKEKEKVDEGKQGSLMDIFDNDYELKQMYKGAHDARNSANGIIEESVRK